MESFGKWSSRYYLAGGFVVLIGAALAGYAVAIASVSAPNAVTGWYFLATTYVTGAGARSLLERRKEYLEGIRKLDETDTQ